MIACLHLFCLNMSQDVVISAAALKIPLGRMAIMAMLMACLTLGGMFGMLGV